MKCLVRKLRDLRWFKFSTVPTVPIHPILAARILEWQAGDDGSLGTADTVLARKYKTLREQFDAHLVTLSSVKVLMAGVQAISQKHYVSESVENWASLADVLTANQDDCDGLDLLAFWALRDAGEPARRAVYRNTSTGMGHMVTLWDHSGRTYILDPTGAMSTRVNKVSWLRTWELIAEFAEEKGKDDD
jgi:hypothetical protein